MEITQKKKTCKFPCHFEDFLNLVGLVCRGTDCSSNCLWWSIISHSSSEAVEFQEVAGCIQIKHGSSCCRVFCLHYLVRSEVVLGFTWKLSIWCLVNQCFVVITVGLCHSFFLKLWSWLALAKVFLQGSGNCVLRYLIPTSTLRHPSQWYGNTAAFRRAGVTWLFFLVTECLIKITLWHGYLCLHSIKL